MPAPAPKIGQTVAFHILTEHRCKGKKCQCKVDLVLPAKILHVWPAEPGESQAVVLEVAFPPAMVVGEAEIEDHLGRTITTKVTREGYSSRQSQSHAARQEPPESGSWTAWRSIYGKASAVDVDVDDHADAEPDHS